MAATLVGPVSWKVEQDEHGHREYTITHRVNSDREDGPYIAMTCPGLPEAGGVWNFDNDLDPKAVCKKNKKADQVVLSEANEYWLVESYYSTKPSDECYEDPVDDPLEEPYKITSSVVKYTEEGILDRFGKPIHNSAHEQIRGPQNEWDASRSVIRVTWNVVDLELAVLNYYLDRVNQYRMWGLNPRSVKFSNYSWTQKFRALCDTYYERTLEFEVRREGFDRSLLDEGTKVLNGHWDPTSDVWINDLVGGFVTPNPLNPAHFIRAQDRKADPIRVLLDGAGNPWQPFTAEEVKWWCVQTPDEESFTHESTCSELQYFAIYSGAYVLGPYDTEGEAEAACGDAFSGELMTNPHDLICSTPNQPVRRLVQKYLEGDLITKLRLPTTIG